MKTAIVTDSNSGIFQEEARALGISSIPMPVIIEGETRFENQDITHPEFFQALSEGKDVSSSQPSPGTVIELWKTLLKDHDEVVYIPMSSGLSGSCAASMVLANEFDGKVQVVDNHRISVTMRQAVQRAAALAKEGLSAKEIKARLEEEGPMSCVYLTVETLAYFKKSGRVTPTTAAIGDILNIKPVLMTKGEKFETCAKVHGAIKAKATMLKAVQKDRETIFADYPDEKIYIGAASSCTDEADAEKWFQKVKEAFPDYTVYYDPLSLSISCHTGPDACGIGISLKPE
ncbi:MAG: DegV family protein [Solobacterium sp.]|nr:DegV family protein [Solobacterium sp.]